MTDFIPLDYDIIFISYDEPNADKNFENLQSIVPWAKRVHGVKGSDSAHKAAGRLSETDRFISIDGDNVVDINFFDSKIRISDGIKDCIFSWSGKNSVNGLIYGNGGIKCWPKDLILSMKTHENALGDVNTIEFCFHEKYYQFNECWSTCNINGSEKQAWRAGFREGTKLSLNQTKRPKNISELWWQNYHRLLIWLNVGIDVKNGIWAIYGARLGCYMTLCTDWDYLNVRDFDWLNSKWDEVSSQINDNNILNESDRLGNQIKNSTNLEIASLDISASLFFKKVYNNMPRVISE